MRKTQFAEGEFYHIYNRGTDKREIFSDNDDFARFLQSMREFNTKEPIGSIYEHSRTKAKSATTEFGSPASKLGKGEECLVKIVAYCLNGNHFHFILEQATEKGIEKFMQRLGTGYTKYYNHKYERTGVLFQGKFKAIHIDSNEYLLHLSSYVNLNYRVHKSGSRTSKYRASWEEYMGKVQDDEKICSTDPIVGQFRNISDYASFAENSLQGTLERRGCLDDTFLLE